MAGSVNKVTLVGNLGRDPEVRMMQSGDKVANLSVATSENWKDKNGERQERTEWHRIVIFSQPLVKLAESYLKKGSKIYLEGQLATRKWTDNNGVEKYSTEVVLRPYKGEITMLDSRGDSGGSYQGNTPPPFESAEPQGGTSPSNDAAQPVDTLEDEIPF